MPMNEIVCKRPLTNNNMIHNNILVQMLRWSGNYNNEFIELKLLGETYGNFSLVEGSKAEGYFDFAHGIYLNWRGENWLLWRRDARLLKTSSTEP